MLKWLSVVGMAMLPLVELKGAIPYGMALGIEAWTCFYLALIGSCLPAPFIMWLFHPVVKFAHKREIKWLCKIMDYAQNKGEKKMDQVTKYQNWQLFGLFVFVAIPLPTTGVWTGSVIATLLQLPMKKAVPTVMVGNVVAGLLVFLVSGQFF